ncbi:hypothetical protein LK07_29305 [Streptomyces pluripotens]|uniref:Uncharacterized protein n=1 Tax=Streptomyces pluripotens TaxID=1355015 RepID=A0A221P5C3_9ACTN|nr:MULTISPECIES: hypothetical protein [Streptomyces]ARP73202.1 hypothetical protein LK06_028135 [Streptomyces pluripotens]ASN27451.1 hypothetical protein LK07_29305 [Streptomyces pluripotens]MCH0558018.1 hypothetical protein [Streptomyces sp. MUM 16J]
MVLPSASYWRQLVRRSRHPWTPDERKDMASLRRLLTGLLDVDDALAESLHWSARQHSTVPHHATAPLASLTEQVSAAR